ncbi:alpha/beta hydrolase [Vibrio owensii]|uniref:alpha/beta hydrolase n=1 Tax=Vibrio owensii TaxID=696485 RepID=UPI001FD20D5D|nr:alpha/beta hydrolase [Vibrio owensii]
MMKLKKLNIVVPALIFASFSTATMAKLKMDERDIPTPAGISTELAHIIENRVMPPVMPVPNTTQEWLDARVVADQPSIDMAREAVERLGVSYEEKRFAGVDTFFVTPKNVAPEYADKWLIHIHGGAFVLGGGDAALREAIWLADGIGAKVISVDYRQPPLHPFPAAIDDAVAVWKELTKTQSPESTAIFGTSAGGNITLATALKIQELGLPEPGALYVGTPAVDLKETSDSWHVLRGLDPLGQREGAIDAAFELYAGGEPMDNPLISPIYADIETFPPTIFISGTRDLLLSDTVRMHRKLRALDVDTHLHVYDGQAHADYMTGLITDVPESEDALKEIGQFFNQQINR